jgi:hypothetical protein
LTKKNFKRGFAFKERGGLFVYEIRCGLKSIRPVGKIKVCIMKKRKAGLNTMTVTTFGDTILLGSVWSSGVMRYAMM